MFNLSEIQTALQNFQIDGWLLYDFRGSNVLAKRVLGLGEDAVASRRFLYCIPAVGEPVKLVHRIESGILDHLPGEKIVYLKWQELEKGIQQLLSNMKTIAMEYSPGVSNPYVSKVDAGTLEFVRSLGVNVVSSGDLVQLFEATLDDEMWQLHLDAAQLTDRAFDVAWQTIAQGVNDSGGV
ncbi:Aminopeptidase YpdF (MP-, MA-, MS-, AP-, NP-specific), partial [hydrothermal vent metagenome]